MRKRSGAGLPSLRGGDVVRNTLHKKEYKKPGKNTITRGKREGCSCRATGSVGFLKITESVESRKNRQ
jgi:hypothetical protein